MHNRRKKMTSSQLEPPRLKLLNQA